MRKRMFSALLTLLLVVAMLPVSVLAAGSVSLTAGKTSTDYDWQYVESETYGAYYELTNVVYVGAPVAPDYQSLHIYVPAALFDGGIVNGYTAETAPVIMANSASGWAGKTPSTIDGFGKSLEMDWAGILEHGYVLVSIGTRGPATTNDDGTYNGKAPENVADAKAAVRFLKANANSLPGDMNKIISAGTSGGGGMSTIIGASGNADEYLPYLYDMDACGVELLDGEYVNTGDDSVYGMLSYAAITDLDNADLGYNWFYGANEDYTDFEKAVVEDMSEAYVEYILSLGICDNMEQYEEGFVAMFEAALNASGTAADEGDWVVANGDGTYSIAGDTTADKLAAIVANHNSRGKAVLGFDNLTPGTDSRAENQLFGLTGTTTNRLHFSEKVANILLANKEEYALLTDGDARYSQGFGGLSFAGGSYTAFQTVYAENEGIPGYTDMIDAYETALSDEMKARVYMMNPINYIVEYMDGSSQVKPADHFRAVYGSNDSNTSPTVVYNLKCLLEKAGIDADYSMYWNGGHGKFTGEAAETKNFFAWVESICSDDKVISFSDVNKGDWYYDDVMYAAENGLMTGNGDGSFAPYENASRAMVVTVLYRLAGSPAVKTDTVFTDLTQDWYKDAVAWAVANGITTGSSATTFEPDKAVSRQELATFLYRYAGEKETDADLSAYTDSADIAPWAVDAMAWANAKGIIIGKTATTLCPNTDSNRAELATVLVRFCK